jgi:hypothetical protein
MSVSKKEPTVQFTGRVKNSSMFIRPQADDIWKMETEDTNIFPRTISEKKRQHDIAFSFAGLHAC